MAGIGFELKKLFKQQGLLAVMRAYGYTATVCIGPMILGVVLLVGVRVLSEFGGASRYEQDLLGVMITYSLLASLLVSSIFSMVTTRYSADMIFLKRFDRVLPSLYGSAAIMLVIGGVSFGTFLMFSGAALNHKILCFVLFCELVVVWTQINYITVLKDYRSSLIWFLAGILIAGLCGIGLIFLKVSIVESMLISVCIAYGTMLIGYSRVLQKYLPKGVGSAFAFLEWIDKYPSLLLVGLFLSLGLFSHLVIIWFSPIGVQVQGLFYGAPRYDIPALVAFTSVLSTTVNFIASFEVNFYPKYRRYFGVLNEGGTLNDVERAEKDMLTIMRRELNYIAQKQLIVSGLFIIFMSPLLTHAPFGFIESMVGTFHILCAGYGVYALGNTFMLCLLYFADNKGAFISVGVFAVVSTVMTIVLLQFDPSFYGFGFVLGGVAMYVVAARRLSSFTGNLQFEILASQPILAENKQGVLTHIARSLSRRADDVEVKRAKKQLSARLSRRRQDKIAVKVRGNHKRG